jgi:hypothetical protein
VYGAARRGTRACLPPHCGFCLLFFRPQRSPALDLGPGACLLRQTRPRLVIVMMFACLTACFTARSIRVLPCTAFCSGLPRRAGLARLQRRASPTALTASCCRSAPAHEQHAFVPSGRTLSDLIARHPSSQRSKHYASMTETRKTPLPGCKGQRTWSTTHAPKHAVHCRLARPSNQ